MNNRLILFWVFLLNYFSGLSQTDECRPRADAAETGIFRDYQLADSIKVDNRDTIYFFSAGYGYEYIDYPNTTYDYSDLKGFANLQHLDVGNLSGDPKVLCGFTELISLHLLDPDFYSLSCLDSVQNLKEFYFHTKRRCDFPNFIYQNRSLCYLGSHVKYYKTIPDFDSLSYLNELRTLDITVNNYKRKKIHLIVDNIYKLKNIENLVLIFKRRKSLNLYKGEVKLPSSFSELNNLEMLWTSLDVLTDSNIAVMESINNLRELHLEKYIDDNNILRNISKLKNLEKVTLHAKNKEDATSLRAKLETYLPGTTIEIKIFAPSFH